MAYMNVFKRLKSINTCMMFYVLYLYANILHKYKTMPFNIGELHFSTNGCKVDTNNLLSYFSDFLYLQLKSAAAQFEVIINALFCPCMRNLNTKQHVKPHVYCFLSFDNFWQQFWSEFDMKKPVQEMFTFWS